MRIFSGQSKARMSGIGVMASISVFQTNGSGFLQRTSLLRSRRESRMPFQLWACSSGLVEQLHVCRKTWVKIPLGPPIIGA